MASAFNPFRWLIEDSSSIKDRPFFYVWAQMMGAIVGHPNLSEPDIEEELSQVGELDLVDEPHQISREIGPCWGLFDYALLGIPRLMNKLSDGPIILNIIPTILDGIIGVVRAIFAVVVAIPVLLVAGVTYGVAHIPLPNFRRPDTRTASNLPNLEEFADPAPEGSQPRSSFSNPRTEKKPAPPVDDLRKPRDSFYDRDLEESAAPNAEDHEHHDGIVYGGERSPSASRDSGSYVDTRSNDESDPEHHDAHGSGRDSGPSTL